MPTFLAQAERSVRPSCCTSLTTATRLASMTPQSSAAGILESSNVYTTRDFRDGQPKHEEPRQGLILNLQSGDPQNPVGIDAIGLLSFRGAIAALPGCSGGPRWRERERDTGRRWVLQSGPRGISVSAGATRPLAPTPHAVSMKTA